MSKTQEKIININSKSTFKFSLLAVVSIMAAESIKYEYISYMSLLSLVIPLVLVFESNSFKQTALYGFVFGFVYYFTLNDWFVSLLRFSWGWLSFGWIMSSVYLSLFTVSTFLLTKVIHRRFKNQLMVWFLVPVVWMGFELLRTFGLLSFPFGAIGYSLIGTVFQKSASLWGWAGLSFLVIATNVFIVLTVGLIFEKKYQKIIPLFLLQTILLITALIFPTNTPRPQIKVSALKTDFDSVTKFQEQYEENVKTIIKLTKKVERSKPSIVLIPETSFSYADMKVISSFPRFDNVVFGSLRQDGNESFNSAYLWNKNKLKFIYDKNNLVLMGEYIPWRFLSYYIPVLDRSLTSGTSNGLFVINKQKAGIAICSESTNSMQIKGIVDKGAGLLAVITNDEWFKGSSMPYQHFQITRLRAIESGRYLIMSANGMPSAVFKPNGLYEASQKEGNGYVNSKAAYIYKKTFYNKLGWILPYISLVVIGLILVWELFKTVKEKGKM